MAEKALSPRLSPANLFDLPAFVVTPQVMRVVDLCAAVQQTRTLGLLVGLPGVGKTWAVRHAAQNQPEPEEITASPVLYTSVDVQNTPNTLLHNLLDCLGPDYRAPVSDMVRLACCWIHRRQVELIILDEADRLDRVSWEVIRDIHDRTHCAFLFVGQPALQIELRRHEQLLNRVSLTVELQTLAFDDLVNFLRQWQDLRCQRAKAGTFWIYPDSDPGDLLIVKEIYRVTLGNLRRVCNFVQEAERIAGVNGQQYVFLPVVEATARLLTGEQE